MKKLIPISICCLFLAGVSLLPTPANAAASIKPTDLRCEYRENPLGIDTPRPRFSWTVVPTRKELRNQTQLGFHLLVASSEKLLAREEGDLWDSGRTTNAALPRVTYGGEVLFSGQQCFWKVRVWDNDGQVSNWSEPARFSMGLLGRSDWRGANWIGLDESPAPPQPPLLGANWIWFPEGRPEQSAPLGNRYFAREVQLPKERSVKKAMLSFTADNTGEFFVNGVKAGSVMDYHVAGTWNIASLLKPGDNVLAASVSNIGGGANPAGFIARLEVEFDSGAPLVIVSDASWQASQTVTPDWPQETMATAGSPWARSQILGPAGMGPWGEIVGQEDRRLPARYLRREFTLDKRIRRATAYLSGLGLSELFVNGERIQNQVLSPALTDYSKRVFYVTHDVTEQVKRGPNAIGVVLGNGRYYGPRGAPSTVSYGYPKLLFILRVEFADGTIQSVASDSAWNLTTEGPIRANNEYDGEEYDARLELGDWSRAGYNDHKWRQVQMVQPPGGALRAQMIEPIRITGTIKPLSVSEPRPGQFIFDLGQNMVGWCRLRVSGPKGTQVSLRHAEVLKPDGTLYLDNIRGAKVTDTYTLRGKGTEVYEPSFTYHGFRYVEVAGYPGKPPLSAIEGRVVNDDVAPAGHFESSNTLLNQIYSNIMWGIRGNYRSMPTDCPQRDERQGWLGDRSAESKGETYFFNIALLYSKWLDDMADAQKESGSVSDVCPAYWPIYSDNVTWPSATAIIPGTLHDQYGDVDIVAHHYPSARKWIDHMSTFVTNGIIARDTYGDWCVPPEEQKLIHSNDPNRKTDGALLATAYFYYDLRLMARYATTLGKHADAKRFSELADRLKKGFNERFLNTEAGYYDNGSQTSCVLPLAFGLVPETHRQAVFNHLVRKITEETRNHVGTGLIGGQWLMRVLSDHGRSDLAYTIASQETYPSWGYMVNKGATTIWELWNGDTADPAMNSGNHVMLVGDLAIWMHEYLAGIRPDPEAPGFKRLLMNPQTPGDLEFVKASHRCPYGLILSEWKRKDGRFTWDITIPPNTTATICVPAISAHSVKEGGKPVDDARGVKFEGFENGRAKFEIGSGKYTFESNLAN